MRLLEAFAELIAPTRCAGCDLPGTLLCGACDATLPRIEADKACPACAAPFGGLVCTECWSSEFAFEAALALGVLDGPLSRAVVLHKDAGEQRLGAVLGTMLGAVVTAEWGEWPDTVAWVPPTRAALTRRGFDHGRALAEPVAATVGCPAVALLDRAAGRDQRALGREARAANAAGTFTMSGRAPGHVLLVDDVLTTGATLDSAANTLLSNGADSVRVAVVARAW